MTDNKDTDALLAGRQSTYGDVTTNAERVAKMWNGYLGTDIITPADMMMMMALYKAYRFKVTPDYSDNINDVLGYAQIVRSVQEETGGLIDAETVKEYLQRKAEQASGEIVNGYLARGSATDVPFVLPEDGPGPEDLVQGADELAAEYRNASLHFGGGVSQNQEEGETIAAWQEQADAVDRRRQEKELSESRGREDRETPPGLPHLRVVEDGDVPLF